MARRSEPEALGTSDRLVRAFRRRPGTGQLIGEHADANEGLMLPMAIEPSIQLEGGHGELWQVEGIAGVR